MAETNQSTYLKPFDRWVITAIVMLATVMQVLDTTIVNVALPHMQGALRADPNQVTWSLTSYLVASVISMPLTGYFTDKLGQKKLMLICVAGFTLTSALCGVSQNLSQIVLFRFLQGAFGAPVIPLSQAIMTNIFPVKERGKAMAVWGMGVMLGPILGPTLGGYLTDVANWRWIFYVNIPFGIITFFAALKLLPDSLKIARKMDWTGLILFSLFIGFSQCVLDQGNDKDWLNSDLICVGIFIIALSALGFALHCLSKPAQLIFNLNIFKDRNFSISCLILMLFGLGMFGAMVLQPMMLENLLNYPVLTTGLVMAPRGIASIVGMSIVAKISSRVDNRYLVVFGCICCGFGMYVPTFYPLDVDLWWLVWPIMVQGFGLAFIFAPLSTFAFTTLNASLRTEAAGMLNLLRTLGSSMGISIVMTVFTRHTQMAWNYWGGFIQPDNNPALNHYLQNLHIEPTSLLGASLLTQELLTQAQMVALMNTYAFITWCFVIMLPLVFLLKKPIRSYQAQNSAD